MTIFINDKKDIKKVRRFLNSILETKEIYKTINVSVHVDDAFNREMIEEVKDAKKRLKEIEHRSVYPVFLVLWG